MGHGNRRVRDCLRRRGVAFRANPKKSIGLHWCRACGYQLALHEQLVDEVLGEKGGLRLLQQTPVDGASS